MTQQLALDRPKSLLERAIEYNDACVGAILHELNDGEEHHTTKVFQLARQALLEQGVEPPYTDDAYNSDVEVLVAGHVLSYMNGFVRKLEEPSVDV